MVFWLADRFWDWEVDALIGKDRPYLSQLGDLQEKWPSPFGNPGVLSLGGGASPASRVAGAIRVLGIDNSAHANSNHSFR